MFYYITIENNQIICLTEGELPLRISDNIKEITENESQQIHKEGMNAFLYDSVLKLKPFITLSLDKPQILSDGIDTVNLTITALGVTSLDIYFNGTAYSQPLIDGLATIPIVSTNNQTITISVNPLLYRFNTAILEVV